MQWQGVHVDVAKLERKGARGFCLLGEYEPKHMNVRCSIMTRLIDLAP